MVIGQYVLSKKENTEKKALVKKTKPMVIKLL